MEGEAISAAQSFLPVFQREGRFGKLALPLPRWQPAAGSGKRKFSLSAAGCPAPPVSPAMRGHWKGESVRGLPCQHSSPPWPGFSGAGTQVHSHGAGEQASRPSSTSQQTWPPSSCLSCCLGPVLNHTMAADIYGAVAWGTTGAGDLRVSGLKPQAGLGNTAQMIRLTHGCPCPTPDTTPSLHRPYLSSFSSPEAHFFPLLSLSSFSFSLLALSSLRSILLLSFSLPFLPLLLPFLSSHNVFLLLSCFPPLSLFYSSNIYWLHLLYQSLY